MAKEKGYIGVRIHYHDVEQAAVEFDGLARLAKQFNAVSLPNRANSSTVPLQFRTAEHRRGFYDTLLDRWKQGKSQFHHGEFVPSYA